MKPSEFDGHPYSFAQARDEGLVRCAGKRAVDGDTIVVLADPGFYVYPFVVLRLAHIDTPETVGLEAGAAALAKAFTAGLTEGKPLLMRTTLTRGGQGERLTFERFVADVWYFDEGGRHLLSDAIWVAGHGKRPEAR